MSHIRNKEEILKLGKYLDKIKDNIDNSTIKELLDEIVPKTDANKNLTGIVVTSGKILPAAYIPNFNTINISLNAFEKITDETAKMLGKECKIDDEKTISNLRAYYRLFTLLHETEHAYQFAIAKDLCPFKYNEVKSGYKNIAKRLLVKNQIIPNPIEEIKSAISFFKYKKNAYDYVLERNASCEALDDIIYIAKENNEERLLKILDDLYLSMLLIGYENDNKGAMYNTHKGLYLLKKYRKIKKDESMSEEERLRFGLDIKEETREKLLSKTKDRNTIL